MKESFSIPSCLCGEAPVFAPDKPWLAPLAGYSDLPFRLLCREYGAAVCVTEMVSAKGLFYQNARTRQLFKNTREDAPLLIQLFGADPEIMGSSVRELKKAGWLWFDCNMGCSVRKVFRQGAGAALLADTDKAMAVARAMIKAAQAEDRAGKAGFKLRLGINPERPVLPDLALRLEDAGAAWITLHPRYASQGFEGEADWKMLELLSRRISIPLIASGDLLTAEKGLQCLEQTGATAVMYARGALRNPAIFRDHVSLCQSGAKKEMNIAELRLLIDRHIALSKIHGHEKRAFSRMRSLAPRYVKNFAGVNEFRKALCACANWEDLERLLDNFLR